MCEGLSPSNYIPVMAEFEGLSEEDQEFKIILNHIPNSRPDWAT